MSFEKVEASEKPGFECSFDNIRKLSWELRHTKLLLKTMGTTIGRNQRELLPSDTHDHENEIILPQ